MSIAEKLKLVQARIAAAAKRAGRDPSSVRLVLVTKTVDVERVREALAAGAAVFGENRVQEAKGKIEKLGAVADWHLIGRLQTNKAKYAVRLFSMIHSIDSLELALELDRQAAKCGKVQDALVEINIAGEASKAGVASENAADLIREASRLKHLSIKGLMTIPPFFDEPEKSRPYFRGLRELAAKIGRENIPGVSLQELSMGMSGDFETAVEEGSTLVRVGTAVFGERR
jgi:PLP dependent protein